MQNDSQTTQHAHRNSSDNEDVKDISDSEVDIGHPLSDESSTLLECRVCCHYFLFTTSNMIHSTENPYQAGGFTAQ